MSGLTVAQLIDVLMPLVDSSELDFCIKYGISHGTFKHWKHDGTRSYDPPRKLIEALSDATSIPVWRIYYASMNGDMRYLLGDRHAEIDRVKDHPLFAGLHTGSQLYLCISNAQKARTLERGHNAGEALRFYEKSLHGIDPEKARFIASYIRIHMLRAAAMQHGVSEAEARYIHLKDDLSSVDERQSDITSEVTATVMHLMTLADAEWFLTTAGTMVKGGDFAQAEHLLEKAIEVNLTVQVPLLQLYLARCYVAQRNLLSARTWVSLAERSVGALHHPRFNAPEWFLDIGDILPDGRYDYSWEEREVLVEKQRIFSASLHNVQHECKRLK